MYCPQPPKKRVLVAYGELLEYRIGAFEALASQYDLTVVHSGRKLTVNDRGFDEVVIPAIRCGRLRFQPHLRHVIQEGQFEAVIFFLDLAWVDIVLSLLFPPFRGRRITWGLWRTGHAMANALRLALARRANCNIFYSRSAASDFVSLGLPAAQAAVATNSILVRNPARDPSSARDSVLVVGTFSLRKQNDVTVAAFAAVAARVASAVRLVFVGEGADRARIEMLAAATGVADRIEFHPAIHDDELLRRYYARALCSVSFGQAGLSVLQSFAFGVAFVTRADAITGGELENIVDGQNGILCDGSQASLEDALERFIVDPELARRLGENALTHYRDRASVKHMIAGFVQAVEGCSG